MACQCTKMKSAFGKPTTVLCYGNVYLPQLWIDPFGLVLLPITANALFSELAHNLMRKKPEKVPKAHLSIRLSIFSPSSVPYLLSTASLANVRDKYSELVSFCVLCREIYAAV